MNLQIQHIAKKDFIMAQKPWIDVDFRVSQGEFCLGDRPSEAGRQRLFRILNGMMGVHWRTGASG